MTAQMSESATSRLINNIDNHAIQLVNNVSSLFNVNKVNNRFSDIQVTVGNRIFYCHKLILQMNSEYLAKLSFQSGAVTLQSINPDQFYDVLQFMYTGEVLVSKENLESLLSAADILCVEDLKKICVRFLETENKEHAMTSWKLADKYKEKKLVSKFQREVLQDFKKLTTASNLRNATEEMMMEILRSDELGVKSEVEVCEMLLTWLEVHTQAGHTVHPYKLLMLIRWSGISEDYINTKLICNSILSSDPESVNLLTSVISYLHSGIQFRNLLTFHRPSTALENCLVIFGIYASSKMFKDIACISLQQPDVVTKLGELPDSMCDTSVACVLNDTVYITGTGRKPHKELWKWNVMSGLEKCSNMATGRTQHCAVTVGLNLFVIGGRDINAERNIFCYSTETDEWSVAGDLVLAVFSSACVSYKGQIYVFGGKMNNSTSVDYVQVFNPVDKSCYLIDKPMPKKCSDIKAVLWETMAILFCCDTCFIFNFECKTWQPWQEREEFKTNLISFGIVLDNTTIYIVGGSDEIKCVSVSDIIDDKLAVWKRFGKLPGSGKIIGGSLTLPLSS